MTLPRRSATTPNTFGLYLAPINLIMKLKVRGFVENCIFYVIDWRPAY